MGWKIPNSPKYVKIINCRHLCHGEMTAAIRVWVRPVHSMINKELSVMWHSNQRLQKKLISPLFIIASHPSHPSVSSFCLWSQICIFSSFCAYCRVLFAKCLPFPHNITHAIWFSHCPLHILTTLDFNWLLVLDVAVLTRVYSSERCCAITINTDNIP